MARSFSSAEKKPSQPKRREWPFSEKKHCKEPLAEKTVSFNGEIALHSRSY